MRDYAISRRKMIDEQLIKRGITDPGVLKAMGEIPRHLFVEEAFHPKAYNDTALPIGEGQTISQPYTVALMTQALELRGRESVLEIGTGSGYQAAVLGKLTRYVYSVERIEKLARRARKLLDTIGCAHVNIRVGDGTTGWKEKGPFDRIITTAGAPEVPPSLLAQLEVGGILVIPVGDADEQTLVRVRRVGEDTYEREMMIDCRFVPLIGAEGWERDMRRAR